MNCKYNQKLQLSHIPIFVIRSDMLQKRRAYFKLGKTVTSQNSPDGQQGVKSIGAGQCMPTVGKLIMPGTR